MKALEALTAAAPTGKVLLLLGGTIATAFFAGIGWDRTTINLQEAVAQIPVIQERSADNARRLGRVETQQDLNSNQLSRILCYVQLIAEGEDPGTELNPRCP